MNLKSLLLKNIVCLLFFITMPFALLGQNSNIDPLYSASENPASMTMDAPSAVPVLSPEEAREANEEALHIYRKQKLKGITTSMIKIIVGILLIAYFVYLHKKKKLKSSLLRFYHSPFGRMFYSTRFCHWDCFCILVVFGITFFFSMLAGENATRNGYIGRWYQSDAAPIALSIFNTGKITGLVAVPDSPLDDFIKKGSNGELEFSSITNKEAVPQEYTGESSYWESTGIAWMIAFWWKLIGHPDWSTLYILFSLFHGLIAVAAYCALRQVTGLVPSIVLGLMLSSYPLMIHQSLFSIRDGARALFCFIAIAVLLYQLKGGFRWNGTIISSIFLFVICSLSTYFRSDFIVLIPFIVIAVIFFHGKIFANYKKKIAIILCIIAGLIVSSNIPGKIKLHGMSHVLYIGMADFPFMENLYFSADNYSNGICYSDIYGLMFGEAKAYRDRGAINISIYTKAYDQECKKEINGLFQMYPYDFFRLALSSSIQSLHIGSSFNRSLIWIESAPGHRFFQKLSKDYYANIPSWLYLALLLGTVLLFLGGGFYKNALLVLAFMFNGGIYMLQFDVRHYFYLLIISLLMVGFVFNRTIRLSFVLLRNWKRVRSICFHQRKTLFLHCSVFCAMVALAFSILFIARFIQGKQIRHQIECLTNAQSESISFSTKKVLSKIYKGVPATEILFPQLCKDVLAREDIRQEIFTEFLRVRIKIPDSSDKEQVSVFATYENTPDTLSPWGIVNIINTTRTCPIRLDFTAGKDLNTLYLPVYFARNCSPLLGLEIVADGKRIDVESVERITDTTVVLTQSAFLVPNQLSEMQYAGSLEWNNIFFGEKL